MFIFLQCQQNTLWNYEVFRPDVAPAKYLVKGWILQDRKSRMAIQCSTAPSFSKLQSSWLLRRLGQVVSHPMYSGDRALPQNNYPQTHVICLPPCHRSKDDACPCLSLTCPHVLYAVSTKWTSIIIMLCKVLSQATNRFMINETMSMWASARPYVYERPVQSNSNFAARHRLNWTGQLWTWPSPAGRWTPWLIS